MKYQYMYYIPDAYYMTGVRCWMTNLVKDMYKKKFTIKYVFMFHWFESTLAIYLYNARAKVIDI